MIVVQLTATHEYFRLLSPTYAAMPLSGMCSAVRGGRFNRPGQEALYLADIVVTAAAEYQQDNPWLPPGVLCTYQVTGLRLADLTLGYDPMRWAPVWAQHAIDWRAAVFHQGAIPPTWLMADRVLQAGLDGIAFPSKANPGGSNLVIYGSSQRPASQLAVHDPQDILPRIRVEPE